MFCARRVLPGACCPHRLARRGAHRARAARLLHVRVLGRVEHGLPEAALLQPCQARWPALSSRCGGSARLVEAGLRSAAGSLRLAIKTIRLDLIGRALDVCPLNSQSKRVQRMPSCSRPRNFLAWQAAGLPHCCLNYG